jgi:predicted outer membrane repeat protein
MYNEYANVAITTSLVQGGLTGGVEGNGTVNDGGGNLDADPDFVRHPDPGSDGNWDGVDDDYGDLHLGAGSPAIDSGTNGVIGLPTDLDGNPRIVDGDGDGTAIVDMGAYEYNCPAGSILYVDYTASGAGGSWLEAKADLALGLKLLSYCPQVSQVWVATGVYTPGVQRSDSFQLLEGVAVYGGFDPKVGADQFAERDWGAYPTVLSGDIAGDDRADAHGVVTTTDHIVGGNSYHVVMADGSSTPITGTTQLEGFTITAGQANGDHIDNNSSGGGFYCHGSGSGGECSPSLRDVTFSGNYARGMWGYGTGGAMYNDGSNPTLTNVTFSGNFAGSLGGAMYNGFSSPTLTNVTFSSNSAGQEGGAMINYNSSPTLTNVTFTGNSAGLDGGAMINFGWDGTSSPTLTNVTFTGNHAGGGGAMYNRGWNGTSSPTLTNVTFSGNSANDGGAMFNDSEDGTSSPTLTNVTFSGNSADSRGGAIYNDGEDGTSSPTLTNVTFSDNSAGDFGGAMYNDGEDGTSSPSLSNVILWGNTAVISGSQLYNYESSVTITTSLVQGGFDGSGIFNENSTVIDGGGNLDADPEFVRHPDPGPDGNWDGVEDDYGDLHLQAGSPAIDTGTNSAISLPTDLDGNPRIVDGDMDGTATVDMGAYEFQLLDVYLPLIFR